MQDVCLVFLINFWRDKLVFVMFSYLFFLSFFLCSDVSFPLFFHRANLNFVKTLLMSFMALKIQYFLY